MRSGKIPPQLVRIEKVGEAMNDPRFEKKLLRQTLDMLHGRETALRSQRLFVLGLYVAGGLLLVSAYLLTVWLVINPRLGILLAAVGGNCVAIAAYTGICIRQWPVLKPHLRAETIEARLRDLEA